MSTLPQLVVADGYGFHRDVWYFVEAGQHSDWGCTTPSAVAESPGKRSCPAVLRMGCMSDSRTMPREQVDAAVAAIRRALEPRATIGVYVY